MAVEAVTPTPTNNVEPFPTQSRRLISWIDSFEELVEAYPSPPIFKRWAAISVIAGALERKVWVKTRMGDLYPNLYTIMVGPPGGGKTLQTNLAKRMWRELSNHYIANDSVSYASVLDDLREASRAFIEPKTMTPVSFHSLKIAIDELGVLIPMYDSAFVNILTSIYDNNPFGERKRTKELNYRLDHPQINLLGGCTPSFLKELMPEGAWDQGFAARVIFIYSGETFPTPMFGDEAQESLDHKRYMDLVHDLKIIGNLFGRIYFTKEAAAALIDWYMPNKNNAEPRPNHPKLLNYNTRRQTHIAKLAMVASVARSDNLIVELEDFRQALDWLLEAEHLMPDIFKSMTMGGDQRVIEETWHYVWQHWARSSTVKEKRIPVRQSLVIQFIAERAPAHAVNRILQVMVDAGILEERNELGKCYVPRGKMR